MTTSANTTTHLTNLAKEYNLVQTKKALHLNIDDNLYLKTTKVAKYIYANLTQKQIDFFINKLIKRQVSDINLTHAYLDDTEIQHIKDDLHLKNTQWKNYCYITADAKLYLVDPANSSATHHQVTYRWTNVSNSLLSSRSVTIYNANFLVGEYLEYKSLSRFLKRQHLKVQHDLYHDMKKLPSVIKSLWEDIISHRYRGEAAKIHFAINQKAANFYLKGHACSKDEFNNDPTHLLDQLDDTGKIDTNKTYQDVWLVPLDNGTHLTVDKKWLYHEVVRNMALQLLEDYFETIYFKNLEDEYGRHNVANRATFYQDKKNINKSTLKVMHEWDQYFKGYFKRVEIDNEVDLHKIEQIKAELLATVKKLPRIKNNLPILRFRKLGNYHAWGMFTSINNTIALDFRNNGVDGSCIQSFIHEYGHYLDFNWHRQQGVLSLDEPYHLILHTVQNYLLTHDVKHKYKNSEYILAPSEIYARSFERYLSSSGLHNDLIRQPNVYKDTNLIEYACFNEQQINHYFDHMFPTIKNALKL